MLASKILKRESERKRERRRRRVAEARQQALAAAKASGLRRILRLPEVEIATGKKRSGIYQDIVDGTFPAPVPLGPRAVGWLETEIMEWQERRIAERGKHAAAPVSAIK
jgi:prophage regulatory protein